MKKESLSRSSKSFLKKLIRKDISVHLGLPGSGVWTEPTSLEINDEMFEKLVSRGFLTKVDTNPLGSIYKASAKAKNAI